MKILLINPPTDNMVTSEIPDVVREETIRFPPLGLMYLQSYLYKELDIKPRILDLKIVPLDNNGLNRFIKEFKPDLVGITAFTHNFIDVINVLRVVKNVGENILTVLGGVHARNFPVITKQFPEIDYVISGDGEIVFAKLVKALANEDFSKAEKLFSNQYDKQENIIDNIDVLPFPMREEISYRKYKSIFSRNEVMTTFITSRGCPYHCKFCDSGNIPLRLRDTQDILEELKKCEELEIKYIYFLDDTFNVDYSRTVDICRVIMEENFDFKWSCRATVSNMDKKLLGLMKKSGCVRIHFGIETDSNEGLKELGKNTDISAIRGLFSLTKEIGIETVAYFMIGLPHQKTFSDIRKTIDFALFLDPTYALFNIFQPYPNTEFFKIGVGKNILNQEKWQKFAESPDNSFIPEFWEEYFNKEELFCLLYEAYRKFYFRPKKIIKYISKKGSLFNLVKLANIARALYFKKS